MTKRLLTSLLLLLMLTLAAAGQTIPAGTRVTVRLGTQLSSATAHTGQTWSGSVARDVAVNGTTVARAGTPVKGTVTRAKPSGRLKSPGVLSVRLTAIGDQAVSTSAISRQGKSHTKSNATKIGGGAVAGALIGGLAGGGKGAAIGAGVGGGAGTGVAAATGRQDVVLPAESSLTFTVSGASANRTRR